MKAERPTMTLPDRGRTPAGLLFGAFVGLITTAMTVIVVFDGLWMLILLASPLLLMQLLFDRILDALIGRWKRWRGYSRRKSRCRAICAANFHGRADMSFMRGLLLVRSTASLRRRRFDRAGLGITQIGNWRQKAGETMRT